MENIALDLLKKKILGEIKRDTNGAVVEVMSEMNKGEIFFSYGVTVAKIKEVAKEYHPNHSLALELFNSKIRELKLVAIYIDSANEVTDKQMTLWNKSFESLEIAEHSSSMLFYAAKDALEIAIKWSTSEDKFTPRAAYLIASKRAKTLYSEKEIGNYTVLYNNAIEAICSKENQHTIRGAENFIVALANNNVNIKNTINNLIKNGVLGDSGKEIEWQI